MIDWKIAVIFGIGIGVVLGLGIALWIEYDYAVNKSPYQWTCDGEVKQIPLNIVTKNSSIWVFCDENNTLRSTTKIFTEEEKNERKIWSENRTWGVN